ncbi:MAG: TlpA family protein disulfide reductase, partial [bacterium]|nr:TlpA family protein disulfide reductase [bacterium]
SLVKDYESRPFALLGVNSDEDLDKLKVRMEKEIITWRSWRNGGSTSGPISTQWNVSGWPTIYLIDSKGVIRYKNVRDDALDEAIEKLVAEAEASK